jgi:hypothetical protein
LNKKEPNRNLYKAPVIATFRPQPLILLLVI